MSQPEPATGGQHAFVQSVNRLAQHVTTMARLLEAVKQRRGALRLDESVTIVYGRGPTTLPDAVIRLSRQLIILHGRLDPGLREQLHRVVDKVSKDLDLATQEAPFLIETAVDREDGAGRRLYEQLTKALAHVVPDNAVPPEGVKVPGDIVWWLPPAARAFAMGVASERKIVEHLRELAAGRPAAARPVGAIDGPADKAASPADAVEPPEEVNDPSAQEVERPSRLDDPRDGLEDPRNGLNDPGDEFDEPDGPADEEDGPGL